MYAYREIIILDDLQKLKLSKPLPLKSGQRVEVLVVADTETSRPPTLSWVAFFTGRNRLLAERPADMEAFMPRKLKEHPLRDPFEGWQE